MKDSFPKEYEGTSFSFIILITNDFGNQALLLNNLDALLESFPYKKDIAFINYIDAPEYQLKEKAAFQDFREKWEVRFFHDFNTPGVGLKKASQHFNNDFFITMNFNLLNEFRELKTWLLEKLQPNTLSGNVIHTLDGMTQTRISQGFKACSNCRVHFSEKSLRIYPKGLSKKLFNITNSASSCFELEALHRAELEDFVIQQTKLFKSDSNIKNQKEKNGFWQGAIRALGFKWDYLVAEPLSTIFQNNGAPAEKKFSDSSYQMRLGFISVALILGFLLPFLSIYHGATWDEFYSHIYGQKLIDYYTSLGDNQSALEYRDLYLYGGLFELIAESTVNIVNPFIEKDYTYEIRHVINAITGFLGILFTGLLAHYIGGWRAGVLVMVFLVLSPRFLGHSMNNPKDIPFATFYIMGIYFITKFMNEFPLPTKRTMGWLILAIAFAINIRIGGLLLICYFGLFLLVRLLKMMYNHADDFKKIFHKTKVGLLYSLLVVVMGYFGGLLFWPYGLQNPLINPFLTLHEVSNFDNLIKIWFEGKQILSTNVPWYYGFKTLAITSPLFVLTGLGLFAGQYLASGNKSNYLMLVFVALFPMVYTIVKGSNLYDGIRQFLFIYPPLIIICANSWLFVLDKIKLKYLKLFCIITLSFLLFFPFKHIFKNFPNEYVYYNALTGGVEGAYGNYEMDYWGNSSKSLMVQLGHKLQEEWPTDSPVHVGSNFVIPAKYVLERYHNNVIWQEYEWNLNEQKEVDYAILIARFFPLDYFENGRWPPEGTIYSENVDGMPISVVKQNKKSSAKEH